ncbi:MAG: hypothetical protein HC841_03820 [Verrucomicrobiae bacterium]|nr:hypothetical protein [Verrucomicrobiae bacterium]NJO55972.1 hypothetical protein [Rhodospirillales bacterium]
MTARMTNKSRESVTFQDVVTEQPTSGQEAPAFDDNLVAVIVQKVLDALPNAPQAGERASAQTNGGDVVVATSTTGWTDFAHSLDGLLISGQDLRDELKLVAAKSARKALADGDSEVPSLQDFVTMLDGFSAKSKGGTAVRAFWWGFHVQVSHEDMQSFVEGAGSVNDIVGAIGGSIPSPAQPYIKLAATFIKATLGLLDGLDHGRGVYVSMSWFAPGVFVPTSVLAMVHQGERRHERDSR